jgi:hypothetical protein
MIENQISYIAFLAGCHIVVLLVLIITFFVVIRKWFFISYQFKTEKIIAIGIVAAFFKNTIYSAAIVPLFKIISNLQALFFLTVQYINADESKALERTVDLHPLNDRLISVTDVVNFFPLANLLFTIALAVLLYKILIRLHVSQATANSPLTVPAWLNRTVVFNSFIIFILIFSGFLVLSVFITIPYLNEIRKPSVFTKARLDTLLTGSNSAVINASNTRLVKLNITTSTPFTNTATDSIIGDSASKKAYQSLKPADLKWFNNRVNDFKESTKTAAANRSKVLEKLNVLAKAYKTKEENAKKALLNNYDVSGQDDAGEKSNLFYSSMDTYQDFLTFYSKYFELELSNIESSDQDNFKRREDNITDLKNILQSINSTQSVTEGSSYYSKGSSKDQYYFTAYYDVDDPVFKMPVLDKGSRKNGEEWGIFGLIAGFLIKTRSYELVLLIGMIGFGIIGASLFSIVPTNDFIETFRTTPIVTGFVNVLTRGFGAAMVVYLATKGGLAIFSASSNTDPNGYILLLTCFVGAVYSENVWAKIKTTI